MMPSLTIIRICMTLLASTMLLVAAQGTAQNLAGPDMLVVTPYMVEDMQELMARDKFAEDLDNAYPGMPNQGIARRLNRAMNASLAILLNVAQEDRSRTVVLERVRGFLVNARTLGLGDAENERIIWCYGQACGFLGIQVEDDQLETWLYGPGATR